MKILDSCPTCGSNLSGLDACRPCAHEHARRVMMRKAEAAFLVMTSSFGPETRTMGVAWALVLRYWADLGLAMREAARNPCLN